MYRQFEQASNVEPCLGCAARVHGICGSLNAADLAAFAATGRHRRLARGQTLMWEGDAPALVVNVISGVLKLTNVGASGDEQIVGLVWPADFAGSPFGAPMKASVTALTDSEVCLFARAEFETFLDTHHDLALALLRRTFVALDQMRDLMGMLGRRSAGQRVAGLLLALAKTGGVETDRISLPLSRQEMADLLGLTIETVSRQLGRLSDDGVIALPDRRSVVVRQQDRLAACAGA
jgi:CRP/FNR family transcriptional regulator